MDLINKHLGILIVYNSTFIKDRLMSIVIKVVLYVLVINGLIVVLQFGASLSWLLVFRVVSLGMDICFGANLSCNYFISKFYCPTVQ